MSEKKEPYSILKTIIKGAKTALVYGIPLLLAGLTQWDPAITSITIGTLLLMIGNWAKRS